MTMIVITKVEVVILGDDFKDEEIKVSELFVAWMKDFRLIKGTLRKFFRK